jgi:hypothetical protein
MRKTMGRLPAGAILAAVGLGVAGCATVTPVVTVPGPNKDAATFHKDDEECRKAASQTAYGSAAPVAAPTGTTPGTAPAGSGVTGTNEQWQRYFASLSQCATAHGDSVAAVPWAVAYSAYLGYPAPYPVAAGYPVGYGYGWGYPYYGWGYPYGYGYPFFPGYYGAFYGVGFGYWNHGWAHAGWHGGRFSGGGFHGGFHH